MNTLVLNKSELKFEDYQKLFVSQFVSHVQPANFNEDDYQYRDGYIISKLKESLRLIRSEAETWKPFLRGYKVLLVRDKLGFHFQMIVLPRNIDVPINSNVIQDIRKSLHGNFYTNFTEEKLRTVFELSPTTDIQTELMKFEDIPMMALSLGMELDSNDRNYEIFFCWNEESNIDSKGFYRESGYETGK